MRMIHGIARILARILFNQELEEDGELAVIMEEASRDCNDYLKRMIDAGQVNAAEEKLFDIIESAAWDDHQKAALVISFYDYLNAKDDLFLSQSDFSRDEIISGLEDAMKAVNLEIPEYLRI